MGAPGTPGRNGASPRVPNHVEARSAASGDAGNVLIVDDFQTGADTLAAVFKQVGYDVRVVDSAESAIQMVGGWAPDVAVVEVVLPGMNGIEFSKALADKNPNCRIILFSASAQTTDLLAEAANRGQFYRVLAKPCHPSEILELARG